MPGENHGEGIAARTARVRVDTSTSPRQKRVMSISFTGAYANEEHWFENHYHCDECDQNWQDCWYCEVDDECPSCCASIS